MALNGTRRPYGKRGIGTMGLLGLGEGLPQRVGGVLQRAASALPVRCERCGSGEIFQDPAEPRRAWCFACGEDVFLVAP